MKRNKKKSTHSKTSDSINSVNYAPASTNKKKVIHGFILGFGQIDK